MHVEVRKLKQKNKQNKGLKKPIWRMDVRKSDITDQDVNIERRQNRPELN